MVIFHRELLNFQRDFPMVFLWFSHSNLSLREFFYGLPPANLWEMQRWCPGAGPFGTGLYHLFIYQHGDLGMVYGIVWPTLHWISTDLFFDCWSFCMIYSQLFHDDIFLIFPPKFKVYYIEEISTCWPLFVRSNFHEQPRKRPEFPWHLMKSRICS